MSEQLKRLAGKKVAIMIAMTPTIMGVLHELKNDWYKVVRDDGKPDMEFHLLDVRIVQRDNIVVSV